MWEKKSRHDDQKNGEALLTATRPPANTPEVPLDPEAPEWEKPMVHPTESAENSSAHNESRTALGRSMVIRGDLSGNEDLLIEGEFEGNIKVENHCLTVGPEGRVKAHIQARQVIVFGKVDGKISARDKIELRKTGYIVGDLVAAGIAVEEGAYIKGTIETHQDSSDTEVHQPAVKATCVMLDA